MWYTRIDRILIRENLISTHCNGVIWWEAYNPNDEMHRKLAVHILDILKVLVISKCSNKTFNELLKDKRSLVYDKDLNQHHHTSNTERVILEVNANDCAHHHQDAKEKDRSIADSIKDVLHRNLTDAYTPTVLYNITLL